LRNARDWRRGEDIRLQELQDHHIFPQAYLKRHGIVKRVDVNTIANRTLISDETNNKIKDKAPAPYLTEPDIFPSGASAELLEPHFLDPASTALPGEAVEDLTNEQAAELYERFLHARQAAMIEEIRRACGIAAVSETKAEDLEPDDVAADVEEGTAPWIGELLNEAPLEAA
jgi:hypothetical protein